MKQPSESTRGRTIAPERVEEIKKFLNERPNKEAAPETMKSGGLKMGPEHDLREQLVRVADEVLRLMDKIQNLEAEIQQLKNPGSTMLWLKQQTEVSLDE